MPSARHAPLDVIFLGLDGVGKTTLLQAFTHRAVDAFYQPTNGYDFYSYSMPVPVGCGTRRRQFRLVDLGGNERIREYWGHYYSTASAVCYVADASDTARRKETIETLRTIVAQCPRPLLLVMNKQDVNATDMCDTPTKVLECFGLTQTLFCAGSNESLRHTCEASTSAISARCKVMACCTTATSDYNSPDFQHLSTNLLWLLNEAVTYSKTNRHILQEAAESLESRRLHAHLSQTDKRAKLRELRMANDAYDREQKKIKKDRASSRTRRASHPSSAKRGTTEVDTLKQEYTPRGVFARDMQPPDESVFVASPRVAVDTNVNHPTTTDDVLVREP